MRDSEAGRQDNSSRRTFLAAVALLPFGLAGCSLLDAEAPVSTPAGDADAFPVKLNSSFGQITIKSVPQRIVALDRSSADACLALGVIPVGAASSGIQKNGATPWFDFALGDRPGPEFMDASDALPMDQIKRLKPDLILAFSANISSQDYTALSAIAPVLAPAKKPTPVSWEQAMQLTGQALGLVPAATGLIKEVTDSIQQALKNYSALNGTTVSYFRASAAPGADFTVYGADSSPLQMLSEFGLQPAAALKQASSVGATADTSSGLQVYRWPSNRGTQLSSQIAVVSMLSSEMVTLKDSPVLNTVPAYHANCAVTVDVASLGFALENASILSMKWVVRNLLPELAKVAYLAHKSR